MFVPKTTAGLVKIVKQLQHQQRHQQKFCLTSFRSDTTSTRHHHNRNLDVLNCTKQLHNNCWPYRFDISTHNCYDATNIVKSSPYNHIYHRKFTSNISGKRRFLLSLAKNGLEEPMSKIDTNKLHRRYISTGHGINPYDDDIDDGQDYIPIAKEYIINDNDDLLNDVIDTKKSRKGKRNFKTKRDTKQRSLSEQNKDNNVSNNNSDDKDDDDDTKEESRQSALRNIQRFHVPERPPPGPIMEYKSHRETFFQFDYRNVPQPTTYKHKDFAILYERIQITLQNTELEPYHMRRGCETLLKNIEQLPDGCKFRMGGSKGTITKVGDGYDKAVFVKSARALRKSMFYLLYERHALISSGGTSHEIHRVSPQQLGQSLLGPETTITVDPQLAKDIIQELWVRGVSSKYNRLIKRHNNRIGDNNYIRYLQQKQAKAKEHQ